jgi:hypothetical protein
MSKEEEGRKRLEVKEKIVPYKYNFNDIFTLETNILYFEGMFHSFKEVKNNNNENFRQSSSIAPFRFEFFLDKKLEIDTSGKEKVNLMFYYNREDGSIEFRYPWFRPISARLEFLNQGFRFTFNKNYLRFSNVVAEGWELIDVFRSVLLSFLVRNKKYMLHAAAVRLGDRGILLPAWGNTGKTSTSWMLAKNGGEFLTDEFAVIDSTVGICYGFPCSSLVSGATAKRFGIKFTLKERASLLFSDTKSKIVSSRFAPGGIKIYPDRLFKCADKAKITELAIIENGPDSFKSIGKHEAFLKIKSIQDYEFGWKSNPFLLAKSFFSGYDLNSLGAIENTLLENFLDSLEEINIVSSRSGEHFKTLLLGNKAPLVE